MIFQDNPLYHDRNISNYKLVLENCSFQCCLLTDVNIAHSDVNIDALFKTAWLSAAYSTASVCER